MARPFLLTAWTLVHLFGIFPIQARQPKIKRCTGEHFDSLMCPLGTYVDIVGADYYHYLYDSVGLQYGGQPMGCDGHPDDCRSNLMDDHKEYFEEMKRKCNGKLSCNDLIAEEHAPVLCGDEYKKSSYVVIQYHCLEKYQIDPISDAVQAYSKKCPNSYHTMECPNHNVIRIVDGFYGSYQDQWCDPVRLGDYDCLVNMHNTFAGQEYLSSVRRQCDTNKQCIVTSSGGISSPFSVMCDRQSLYTNSRYELIVYECVPDTLGSRKCINDYFDDIACDTNTAIKIVSASFGDKMGDQYQHASPAMCERNVLYDSTSYHCQMDVEENDYRYYDDILDACEYKRQCSMITARSRYVNWCRDHEQDSPGASYSEYVTVEYKCVMDYRYDPNRPRSRGALGIYGITDRQTRELLVPILAGVAAFILLLVIILSIVICTMKKRRKRREEEEEARKAALLKAARSPPDVKETNVDARPGGREVPVDVGEGLNKTPTAPLSESNTLPIRAPYAELEPEFYDRSRSWNFGKVPETSSDDSFHKQYTPAAASSSPRTAPAPAPAPAPTRPNPDGDGDRDPDNNDDYDDTSLRARKRYDEPPVPHQPTTIRDIYSIPRKYDNRRDNAPGSDNKPKSGDNFVYQPALFV